MAMDMNTTLTLAYGLMGFVALAGYGPQMRTFWTRPDVCVATPLLTWSLWSSQTVVFFLYAVIANGDPLFMFNSGMFMVATLTCLGMILRGRKIKAEERRVLKPSNVVAFKAA